MPLMPATGRAQVTKLTNEQRAALATLKAARALSRRAWLKAAAAAGVVAAAGPWIVRDAFSSSGELNLLNWSDELPDPVIPDFTAKTGIKVNTTPFSQNEEQVNKLQSTKGQGFDLCQPTRDRAPQFKDLGLLQPFDLNKMPNSKNIIPSDDRGLDQRLDLGRQALPSAALLGHRGRGLAHRRVEG